MCNIWVTRLAISRDSMVHDGNLVLNELHLYGSSRLGMMQMQDTLFHYTAMRMYDLGNTHTPLYSTATITQPTLFDSVFVHQRGSKVYEGTNHLGNILVTYSDKRLTECHEDTIYRYVADVKSQTDYSAFGVLLEERQWYINSDTNSAIYGFNGMRKDNEIYGSGNAYDFGARIYDSRLGIFKSTDPDFRIFNYQSTYCYASNNPLNYFDENGKGPISWIFKWLLKSRGTGAITIFKESEAKIGVAYGVNTVRASGNTYDMYGIMSFDVNYYNLTNPHYSINSSIPHVDPKVD